LFYFVEINISQSPLC